MASHTPESLSRRGEHLESIAIAFLTLSWIFIALRIWTRTYVITNFGWDDSTMVFAGMVFTAFCACILYIEAHGGGTHVTSVSQLLQLTKWSIAGEVTYIVTVMMLKISLGIFFTRIIVKRWQLVLIYSTVSITIVSSLASFFYCLFRCGTDLDSYVLRQIADQCTPRALDRFFAYQHASFTTLTDCVFAILPIFILWDTSMERRAKISVGVILSLAALGCICSIIRFFYVDGLTQVDDFFWNAVNVSIWSTIEPGAGIIAACLATLRPLVKTVFLNARTIQSYASRSIKQGSRSLRSDENYSKQRSATAERYNNVEARHSRRPTAADLEAQCGREIELESDIQKNGESTDCILAHLQEDDLDTLYRHRTPDLDRHSSRTLHHGRFSHDAP